MAYNQGVGGGHNQGVGGGYNQGVGGGYNDGVGGAGYNQGGAGYNQGVGGYPTNQTATGGSGLGYQSGTGYPGGAGTGMDNNYVQPPQSINQTTGIGAGAGAMGGAGAMSGMGGTGATGALGATPVVGNQYVAQTVKSYAVAKKKMSVSGGDWTITDQFGNKAFRVDGRIASVRDRRFLRDAAGTRILTMKKKLITMHDTWEIYAGESSTVLATVKKSSLVQFRTSMDCMLANSNTGKRNPDYQVKGDFFDRNITIFHGAEQAALVTRQITFTTMILDKDTFGVTIFPGVDEALIFALIVIMDEVFLHDDGDKDHGDHRNIL